MSSSPSPHPPRSGDADTLLGATIGGRFRIERRLAAGGMGVVYKAEQVPLGRPVAVKVLKQPPNPDLDESFSKRFLLEAAAVANLNHPHTIVVHDYGRDGDLLYFAMEYLEGATLTEKVTRQGPMHPSEAIHVGLQVASSLQDAHAQGLVHRDLKPSNVMLTHRGGDPLFVKVLDFGLVKMVSRQEDDKKNRLTQSGIMLGSPRYMAPEQVRGSDVDHRADIYAFGAMMCFMLTGKPPFPDGSQFEAMRAHVYQAAPKLRELFPECRASERLEAIVLKCLEKKADDRFAWFGQIAEALKHAALAPEDTDDELDAKATLFREPSMVARAEHSMAMAGQAAGQASIVSASMAGQVGQESAAWSVAASSQVLPQTAMPRDPAASFSQPPPSAFHAPPPDAPAPAPAPAPSSALTWALRIGLVLLFVTGAVVAAVVFPGGEAAEAPTPTAPVPVFDVTAPPPPVAPPPVEATPTPTEPVEATPVFHVTRVVSEPETARVTRQGADLGDTPLSLRIPEGEAWVIEVSAEGHAPQQLTLVGGSQADVVVRLERTRRSGSGTTPPRSTSMTVETTRVEEPEPEPTPAGSTTIRDPWNR
ncbi:MAG: serine/threonine protein kinase [Sandaracinus sp.]|nr:serine/threonine protein kinase [Sandaracinus sp.]MCB9617513.1 serine/threonine protein kinase [Sandaracinus sp.]